MSDPTQGSSDDLLLEFVPDRGAGYRLARKDDRFILSSPRHDRHLQLDARAAVVWDLIDGARSVGVISAILQDVYPANADRIPADVVAVINSLIRFGSLKPPRGPQADAFCRSAAAIPESVNSVFVRIPKTASTSIETVLARYPQLLTNARAKMLPIDDWPSKWMEQGLSNIWISILGQDRWRRLTSFVVVRNPYDRAVSSWQHVRSLSRAGRVVCLDQTTLPKRERFPCDSFDHFLSLLESNRLVGNASWHATTQSVHATAPDGGINVDMIGRFESLQRDFDRICSSIGIETTALPHVNRGPVRQLSYRSCYNRRRRQVVEAIYRKDIELFEYDF